MCICCMRFGRYMLYAPPVGVIVGGAAPAGITTSSTSTSSR